MIFHTIEGKFIDTDSDLTPGERHILQKLFLWGELASSAQEFREKAEEALRKGWNNSGPIIESPALASVLREIERRLSVRLRGR
jgi:hypothetical protein